MIKYPKFLKKSNIIIQKFKALNYFETHFWLSNMQNIEITYGSTIQNIFDIKTKQKKKKISKTLTSI